MQRLQDFADTKFKGLRRWKEIHASLRARGLASVPPSAAATAARRRGVLTFLSGPAPLLLDVREPEEFARGHAAGAENVPLYSRQSQAADAFDRLRAVYFALFGLRVPVRNERFAEEVLELAKSKGGGLRTTLIVLCQVGGTLETTEERRIRAPRLPAPIYGRWGAASRSLFACDELYEAGFGSILHVAGGFNSWCADGMETE